MLPENLRIKGKTHGPKSAVKLYIYAVTMLQSDMPTSNLFQRKAREEYTWFPGGPPLSTLPVPIPDPDKPWGGECNKCIGNCTGHYLTPENHIEYLRTNGIGSCQMKPQESYYC